MQFTAEKLASHLDQSRLLPVYLITGDEPLLLQESADLLRSHARKQGFTEREVFDAGQHFDWQQVLQEANSLSLFSSKVVLEVRLDNKPSDQGKAIIEYCQNPSPDNLLLIIAPALDKKTALNSKWAKAVDNTGGIIQVKPVTPTQLPGWIEKRLKSNGLKANQHAINILASRVEGNLLAASQEIEKLKLLSSNGELNEEMISAAVADSARFNIFSLSDTALQGDATTACRILRGLREEGTEPLSILWLLTREIRLLKKVVEARDRGLHPESVLNQLHVWRSRHAIFKRAASHFSSTKAGYLLRLARAIDNAAKGIRDSDPWEDLTTLIMMLANQQPLNADTLRLSLRNG